MRNLGRGYVPGMSFKDDEGRTGGLAQGSDFVLVGDFGPQAGEDLDVDHPSAIAALLDAEAIHDPAPESAGAVATGADPATATLVARDEDGLQLIRSDYVLPSAGLPATASGVFWPADGQLGSHLTRFTHADGDTGRAAERRLVWTDLGLD